MKKCPETSFLWASKTYAYLHNADTVSKAGSRVLGIESLCRNCRESNTLDVAQEENLCHTKGEEWKQHETIGNKGRRTKTGQTGSETQSQVQGKKIDLWKAGRKTNKPSKFNSSSHPPVSSISPAPCCWNFLPMLKSVHQHKGRGTPHDTCMVNICLRMKIALCNFCILQTPHLADTAFSKHSAVWVP